MKSHASAIETDEKRIRIEIRLGRPWLRKGRCYSLFSPTIFMPDNGSFFPLLSFSSNIFLFHFFIIWQTLPLRSRSFAPLSSSSPEVFELPLFLLFLDGQFDARGFGLYYRPSLPVEEAKCFPSVLGCGSVLRGSC